VQCGNLILGEMEASNGFKSSTKMREPQLCDIFRMAGGRLFRFRHDSMDLAPPGGKDTDANGPRPIGHFWLCERCSNVYTLHNEPGRGVVILQLWPELPATKNDMHLPSP
jgi:hypothetical protein